MEVGHAADDVLRLIPVLADVEEVDLSYTMLSDAGVRELVVKFPNVRVVHIEMCDRVSADSAAVFAHAPRLGCVQVEDAKDDIDEWRDALGSRLNSYWDYRAKNGPLWLYPGDAARHERRDRRGHGEQLGPRRRRRVVRRPSGRFQGDC